MTEEVNTLLTEDLEDEEGEEWDEDEDDDEYDLFEDPNVEFMHNKWICDGLENIDDVIDSVTGHLECIKNLKTQGYRLDETVDNGYMFFRRDPPETEPVS